jgi:hypothetical protein
MISYLADEAQTIVLSRLWLLSPMEEGIQLYLGVQSSLSLVGEVLRPI